MYLATITQKGQVTIPQELRKKYGVKLLGRIKLEASNGFIKLTPTEDILDLAGSLVPKTKKPILKAREEMEKSYQRE
ncbi:MAG TPA: AbrB/MazE/SpoVT family DNA-binding domain-containing protein [Patescibacteria group bacterium]|nr:AbrB/MazE/SpoVT family DNA-binding domain-containing protein [Patescibacteria group bacterium]